MIAVKYLKMNAFDESPFDRKEWKMKRDENKNKNKNKKQKLNRKKYFPNIFKSSSIRHLQQEKPQTNKQRDKRVSELNILSGRAILLGFF